MKKILSYFVVLILMMNLSGCASLNSQFDCPMQPGVMCKSLDQVNKMVDQGKLGGPESECSACSCCKTCSTPTCSVPVACCNPVTPYPIAAINPGDPLRYGETVMRVWMAPFEDSHGNYYQPTVLYTVIKPGHWIGNPVKAITNNEDLT